MRLPTCSHPTLIKREGGVWMLPIQGQQRFIARRMIAEGQLLIVNCGKCFVCRERRKREWALRMRLELKF